MLLLTCSSLHQLLARRGKRSSTAAVDEWTTFEMALREAAPMPNAFDLTRFLASSITFMTHLSEVSVFLDDHRLARLTKYAGPPRELDVPLGLRRTSDLGLMHVQGIKAKRT